MADSQRDVAPPLPEPLDGEVFDAHCHLGGQTDHVSAAIRQAASVGVVKVINVGCEVPDWRPTVASTDNPAVYAAIAVHPNAVRGVTDDDYDELETLLGDPRVVAVGETGLDYYWDRSTPAEQQEHLRRHIELAKRVGKPLMIHDRDAHADVLRILREEGAPAAGVVFHSFSGDAAMAAECVAAGYVLSFSGVLTFKNAPGLRAACQVTPLDQLLVETDAPFLTAHPYRGRPNAPYLIPHVVRAISELKNTSESVVCATISTTGRRIFSV